MNKLELPASRFYVSELQRILEGGGLQERLNTIEYINKYYFEIDGGNYYYYDYLKKDFVFKEKADFTKEVLNKIDNQKDIVDYFKKNSRIFTIVQNFSKPQLYQLGNDYFINLFAGMLHKDYKPYDEYSEEIKAGVQVFFDYLLEIGCNNDKDMLKAYLLYLSQIARCKKTKVIVIKKTVLQGTGKSTEFDFLEEFVFGKKVCLRSGAEPLLTNYNKILANKILVLFEEMPTSSKSEWCAVSSKLKTLATENSYMFRDPYEKPISLDHCLNMQIYTNVNSIQDDGRRNIILDVNCSRVNDIKYFDNLRDKCFNMNVGEAFYSYLLTKISDADSNKFYGQKDFPMTQNKLSKIEEYLKTPFKFLRDEYVLQEKDIEDIDNQELYAIYTCFCIREKLKVEKKSEFYSILKEIGIDAKRKNTGKSLYNVKLDILELIAKRHNWVRDETDSTTVDEVNETENDSNKVLKEELEIKFLKEELEKKDKEIEELKRLLAKQPEEAVIEKPTKIRKKKVIQIVDDEGMNDTDLETLSNILG